MENLSFCNYSDAYIPLKEDITVVEAGGDNAAKAVDKNNKQAESKSCTMFTDCITEINNTQVSTTKDLDVVISMYNLIKYGNNYSKTSGNLYHIIII